MSLSFLSQIQSQTIWNGPTMTFTKANGSNWNLESQQDRITDNVWLTRANNQGIFNIATESGYTINSSPSDTEWAFGNTSDIGSLTFSNWQTTISSDPLSMIGQDMVVHLISEDIFIDIKFLTWTPGGTGGGFSYERSTNDNLSINDDTPMPITIYPNPTEQYINLPKQRSFNQLIIVDTLGRIVMQKHTIRNSIDVRHLTKGIYFLKLDNYPTVKFIKL